MPSSNKTPNLKLNQWSGADCPKRADFNTDNSTLDSQLGGHLKNAVLHVTQADKDTWNSPWEVNAYTGNDLNTRTITGLPFAPSAVFVAAADYPFVQIKQNGARCTAFAGFATQYEGSQGLTLSGNSFTVKETTLAIDTNEFISLNRSGTVYIYILFR